MVDITLNNIVNKQAKCPGCTSKNTDVFFCVKDAPVQSVVTIKTQKEALAIPRKDIFLSFCNDCGSIFNSQFDETINFFENGYEDQQGYSSTFSTFLKDVTRKFIDKYNIYNKNVIEVGCGKGDFLEMFCNLGNNRGIGIDPAFVEGRIRANPNITFLKEYYSEKHANLPKDVITCRHTLEHIYKSDSFIKTIRESIKPDEKVFVFMEVPNAVRILRKQAFWDIYYEHCNYFSPGSLARLFKRNNFEVLDLYREYDDQYLFIEARATNSKYQKLHQEEESITELRYHINRFIVKISKELDLWKQRIQQIKDEGKKVVLWGGGSKAIGFLTQFDSMKAIKHVIDINPNMLGNFIPGIGIQYKDPSFLQTYKPDIVIVMNGVYKLEISNILSGMGLYPSIICL